MDILDTKYINLFIIHIIAFSLMFQNNLELIGLALAITINVLTNSFLFWDIINSPKNGDAVILVLVVSILAIFISSVMILLLLTKLHSKYSSQQIPIQLTHENRILLDNYKISYVTNILLVFIISILYFTLYRNDVVVKGSLYTPFYNYDFKDIMNYPFLIFKIAITLLSLGLSGYMIYSSYLLCQINTNNLYIPPTDNSSYEKPQVFPHKTNNNLTNLTNNMFSNINLDYIIGYN